jgi:hypothetical protein
MNMLSQREAQERFARGLLDASDAAVLGHIAGARGMDAAAGLAVYRNNTFSNYRGALREAYPVVLRLVGADFFDHTADAFVRATPSTFGDINVYGAGFGGFLEGFPGARELAYLPDTARLEWAVHSAFQAGDTAPLDFARLAAVPAERLAALCFVLHPSASLIASRWPILAIWRTHQPGGGEETIDLGAGGCDLLVIRRGHDVDLEPVSAAEFAALAALANRAPLGDALEVAHAADPDFDFGACLRRHAAAGTFADFALE